MFGRILIDTLLQRRIRKSRRRSQIGTQKSSQKAENSVKSNSIHQTQKAIPNRIAFSSFTKERTTNILKKSLTMLGI